MSFRTCLTRSLFLLPLVVTLMASDTTLAKKQTDIILNSWGEKLELSLKSNNTQQVLNALKTEPLFKQLNPTFTAERARQNLRQARTYYAQGKFRSAIKAYDKIPKGTDEWLEAVEEKGWAYFKLGETNNVLAQTKTLLSPTLRQIVGTEPFFLQSIAQLKVCDYVSVLKTHQLFRESQRERMMAIQNLALSGKSEDLDQLISQVNRFPLQLNDLGAGATRLPRLLHRDQQIQLAILQIKISDTAIPILKQASIQNPRYRSLAMQNIRQFQQRKSKATVDLAKRAKTLAQRETNQNFDLLQKINIIEVETIQRVHHDQSLNLSNYNSKGEFHKTTIDELVFLDDGNPWIDELDKFQVRLRSCPTGIQRRM